MSEAKGPSYARLLRSSYLRQVQTYRFMRQAARQVSASGGRPIEGYFAEPEAADFARDLFDGNKSLKRVQVIHVMAEQ